ncbi:hypothetical protein B0H16DRAFT_1452683 [Mycena metata]|uniref:Uncharacterized protein n=1 Tax=Mycena metata TaxID=1033252 RepID=A0AAD7JQ34_9AGAR|nr:hypothetical protein B0H16DRAFT_1452683 [Mycena metata]
MTHNSHSLWIDWGSGCLAMTWLGLPNEALATPLAPESIWNKSLRRCAPSAARIVFAVAVGNLHAQRIQFQQAASRILAVGWKNKGETRNTGNGRLSTGVLQCEILEAGVCVAPEQTSGDNVARSAKEGPHIDVKTKGAGYGTDPKVTVVHCGGGV